MKKYILINGDISKMKKNKIILGTIFLIIVIVIILSVWFIFKNKKVDVYSLKIPEDFVPKKIEDCDNYQIYGGIKYSVENAQEAIGYIKDIYNKYDSQYYELLKLELVDDEKYYYSVLKSEKSNNNDKIYNNTYIFFKRDIIDIENAQINLDKINNKDEIKTIFNIYKYVFNYPSIGYHIKKSSIKNIFNKYIYTIYYYVTTFGDWGMSDSISYYKQNIVINKNNGKYVIEQEKKISEFEGEYHPSPAIIY